MLSRFTLAPKPTADIAPRPRRHRPGLLLTATLWLLAAIASGSNAAPRTVIVGVYENPPIVQRDAHGGFTGLSVEMLRSVADDQGWQLRFVKAPWRQLLDKLRRNQIDLLVGIAFEPERARTYDFTRQTLLNNYGLVVRRPKVAVTSVFDLRDRRVALVAQDSHSREFNRLMREFGVPYTPVELPGYQAVLQALDDGIADAGVVNRAITILHNASYDAMATGIVFNPVEVRYATPKGRGADLRKALDQALATQKQDPASTYQQLLNQWMGTNIRPALPAWASPAAGGFVILVILLVTSNYVIRRQVALRTAELSESEARFRQLADNVKDVFWVCAPNWQQVHYVSPAFQTIWGMTPEQLYANPMSWLDPVHPADRVALEQAMRERTDSDFAEASLPDFRIIGADGRTHWIQARAYPILDDSGHVVRVAGLAEDITERKSAEDTIRFMAFHDPLTRLHNRPAFESRLRAAANRRDNQSHALLYIDLDQFKILNDTCGHTAGDQMLQGLTAQLQRAIPRDHILARLGGDEFGVLIENCALPEAEQAAQQVLDSIRAFRFAWGDKIFSVGASIGLVMVEGDRLPLSGLLSAADMACYAAKDSGRNRVHVYRDDDAVLRQREDEMRWVARLKKAVDEDGFMLHAQPIVPVQHDDQVSHREFLLRMLGEDGELVPPGNFLPAAERFDLMPTLDRWVIAKVLAYIGAKPAAPGSIAFVNLSGQVLNDDGFIQHVLEHLQRNRIRPGSICLEITETAAIANLAKATRLIEALRDQGVLFALDDFGTGMSSFSYLKTLPVDFLKIDGFFIKDLFSDHMNPAIVEAITRIGHTAGLRVIAEWVEDDAALQHLRTLNIDFAQGYATGRPRSLKDAPGDGADQTRAIS